MRFGRIYKQRVDSYGELDFAINIVHIAGLTLVAAASWLLGHLYFATFFTAMTVIVSARWLKKCLVGLRQDRRILQELQQHANLNSLSQVDRAAVCFPPYMGNTAQLLREAMVALAVSKHTDYDQSLIKLKQKVVKIALRSWIYQNAALQKLLQDRAATTPEQLPSVNGQAQQLLGLLSMNHALLKDMAREIPHEAARIKFALEEGKVLPPESGQTTAENPGPQAEPQPDTGDKSGLCALKTAPNLPALNLA